MAIARRSPRAAAAIAVVAALIASVAAADHYRPTRRLIGQYVSVLGGDGLLACMALLALTGAALSAQTRRPRVWLAGTGGVIALLVLAVLTGAPLYWHCFGSSLRTNVPDGSGLLQQTTGITCAPAAAAMLSARRGIWPVNEGQLAEMAGTNPLIGTDEFALAAALERLSHGRLRGRAGFLDLSGAERLGVPFVAYIRRPGLGGHAVLVESVRHGLVKTADPLTGATDTMSPEEFESEWTGIAVWLE